MDKIEISGIFCSVRIGVPDNERQFPQEIRVDVVADVDVSIAARTDHFSDALDYETIVNRTKETAESRSWSLLEALAVAQAEALLRLPRLLAVEVRVRKFPVSLRGRADSVAVHVRRTRDAGVVGAGN